MYKNYNGFCKISFDARGRFARLAAAMKGIGASVGIGVGEDTALYVVTSNDSSVATALGTGGVWIMDTGSAEFNPDTDYFTASNITINYLTENDTYDLTTKQLISDSPLVTTGNGKPHSSTKVFDSNEAIKSILSLALSAEEIVESHSQQNNPRAVVTFRKSDSTVVYYTNGSKFTVSKLLFDIRSQ